MGARDRKGQDRTEYDGTAHVMAGSYTAVCQSVSQFVRVRSRKSEIVSFVLGIGRRAFGVGREANSTYREGSAGGSRLHWISESLDLGICFCFFVFISFVNHQCHYHRAPLPLEPLLAWRPVYGHGENGVWRGNLLRPCVISGHDGVSGL